VQSGDLDRSGPCLDPHRAPVVRQIVLRTTSQQTVTL